MATLDQSLYGRHKKTVAVWLEHLRSGALDEAKETSLHGEFLHDVFGDILGYATFGRARDGQWELGAEKSVVSGGSADGAIGFFSKSHSRVVAPIDLGSDAFVLEVKKRRPKKGAALSPAGLKALRDLFEAEAPKIVEKRARILDLERTIAAAVHEAYGLTAEDLELLRATQPPRMPPGW